MKEAATISNPFSTPNLRSPISFSVNEGKENVLSEDKDKTIEGKKPENEEKKEEKADTNPPPEKPVLTPELQQVIYIIRTNIILWSGKHESEVKL